MIPFINFKDNTNIECEFIHANGLQPFAYQSLLNLLSNNFNINAMLLRPHWKDDSGIKHFNSWDLFLEDFEHYSKENNINNAHGVGHSIAVNLLLRASINNKNLKCENFPFFHFLSFFPIFLLSRPKRLVAEVFVEVNL